MATLVSQPQSQSTGSNRPLDGVRVLDFSHILAGPFCTRLLADFGAEVAKVESATRPDRTGVTKDDGESARRTDRPAMFLNTNRSKKSVTLNLKNPDGLAVARRLAAAADVIVENFSASVMERLGLAYEDLAPLNPGLVYASMAGYGHSGPRRDWTSMNMNLQAYTGLMMATGSEGEPPTAISNSWNDYIGGLHACFGILQALTERSTTGRGANLDLAQFECSVATLAPLLVASAANNKPPTRMGNRSTHHAPQGVYRCAGKDDWCAISVQSDEQWRALVGALGNPDWAQSSAYKSVVARLRDHDLIDQGIQEWTSTLPSTQVERVLKTAGVPSERMRRINDVITGDEGTRVFRPMEDPPGYSMLVTGTPFSFTRSELAPPAPAARLGEHTAAVLREWLGTTDEEIERLQAAGALV